MIQYNLTLKILYYRNSDGENYYADYSDTFSNKLTQIMTDEEDVYNTEKDELNLKFESGDLDPWFEEGGNSVTIVDGSLSGEGNKMLEISGATDHERYAGQDIEVNAKKDDIYVIGGWAKEMLLYQ